jgi:hypothetical protein
VRAGDLLTSSRVVKSGGGDGEADRVTNRSAGWTGTGPCGEPAQRPEFGGEIRRQQAQRLAELIGTHGPPQMTLPRCRAGSPGGDRSVSDTGSPPRRTTGRVGDAPYDSRSDRSRWKAIPSPAKRPRSSAATAFMSRSGRTDAASSSTSGPGKWVRRVHAPAARRAPPAPQQTP